jgi:hypothetical protein
MHRARKGLIYAALCVFALPAETHAGAWLMEEGHGQAVATGTASHATEAFDSTRSLTPTPRYTKTELGVLFEYGITGWFTAILSPGVQHIAIAAPIDASRSGWGYSEFGGRLRIAQGDSWVVSGQTTMRIPGTADTNNPAAIGYTGHEIDVRALFGTSFQIGAWPAFIDLQAAQRFRSGGPPDEFRFDTTFGVRPHPQWMILTQTFSVVSEGAGSALFPSNDYHKLQMSVVHDLTPNVAVQLGAFTTFNGRNALQENGALVGLWYKF